MPKNISVSKPVQRSLGYIIFVSIAAAFGGVLYGYDSAVISGAIGPLTSYFRLSTLIEGLVVSSILIGGTIGVGFAGVISDRFGRKRVLSASALIFLVSAILQSTAPTVLVLIAARIFGGLGIGMASMLSVTYISETAPTNIRGRLGAVYQLANAVGIVSVYFVNAMVLSGHTSDWGVNLGWRVILGLAAVPAAIYFLILLPLPESPRWLIYHQQGTRAIKTLSLLNGETEGHAEYDRITTAATAAQANATGTHETFGNSAYIRKVTRIGIILAVLQQAVGINVIIYYAPMVFKAAGAPGNMQTLTNSMIGIAAFFGVLVSMWLVDKTGRKSLLLWGNAGMAIVQLVVGIILANKINLGMFTPFLITLFLFLFNISMGPVVWILLGEIFPNDYRGKGMSICTVCMWIANWAVSEVFPTLLAKLGIGVTFGFFGVMCVVSLIFVWRALPETKNRSLEEMRTVFAHK